MGALQQLLMPPQENNSIMWGGADAFTHMLVVGPTRCGKTSTILKPMIYQLLLAKKRGKRLGLSVIEPKGDVARMVADTAAELGLPYTHIDPLEENSGKFNVMEGDIDDTSEATVVVLKSLFGKQEAFFAIIQELSARKITQLLKTLHGDDINLMDVVYTIRNPVLLESKVKDLQKRDGQSDLVQFFQTELLGAQRAEYQKYVMGLRGQLENITSNRYLKRVLTGKSSLNLDQHFEEGGILAINTAMGKLRNAGDAFGQFAMMHLQSTTFRRPGTEASRVPHYLIVDEASRYMTPENERFLSIAAEFKTAAIFAIQSLGQLEVASGNLSGKAMKQAFMTNCRNKIVFGGVSSTDAKEFQEEFGKDPIIERQATFEPSLFRPSLLPKNYRDTHKEEYRYTYTQIMDGIPRFHYFYKLVQDGHPKRPRIGKGAFVPRDWREQLDGKNLTQLRKGKLDLMKWAVVKYDANVQRSVELDRQQQEQLERDKREYDERQQMIELKLNDPSFKEPADILSSEVPEAPDVILQSGEGRFRLKKKENSNNLNQLTQSGGDDSVRSPMTTTAALPKKEQPANEITNQALADQVIQDAEEATKAAQELVAKAELHQPGTEPQSRLQPQERPAANERKKKAADDFFKPDEIK